MSAVEDLQQQFTAALDAARTPAAIKALRDEYLGRKQGRVTALVKAIVTAPNLGANVGNDGTIIRVTLPELTEERRREFVKIVRGKGEDAKVSIRNIRRKAKDDLDALKSEVGDDEVARGEKELESVTKANIDAIDDALKKKEAELLEV